MTFDWFKNNGIFMPMINDTGRNVFYKNAIEQSVQDKVVVDIGTGTGLLSVLAAKAGARKVFAVEIDQGRAEYARNVFAEVGVDVEVVNADFLTTDIPAAPLTVNRCIKQYVVTGNYPAATWVEYLPGGAPNNLVWTDGTW
jgi:predicted RNA methylase